MKELTEQEKKEFLERLKESIPTKEYVDDYIPISPQEARCVVSLLSKDQPVLCDGCNVRESHEHRCHGEGCNCNGLFCRVIQGALTFKEAAQIAKKALDENQPVKPNAHDIFPIAGPRPKTTLTIEEMKSLIEEAKNEDSSPEITSAFEPVVGAEEAETDIIANTISSFMDHCKANGLDISDDYFESFLNA